MSKEEIKDWREKIIKIITSDIIVGDHHELLNYEQAAIDIIQGIIYPAFQAESQKAYQEGLNWNSPEILEAKLKAEREKTTQAIIKKIDERINHLKEFKLTRFDSGWTGIESGECCNKCRMTNPKDPLQTIVGCTNPFQIPEQYGKKLCQCHIPFRKVAAKSQLMMLENLKSSLKE